MAAGGFLSRLRRNRQGAGEAPVTALEHPQPDAAPDRIGTCRLRDEVTLCGRVVALTLNPRGDVRGLEAELNDGTGTVSLIFMGRREVPGIKAGRRLTVNGRLTLAAGQRVIYNPRYTLLAD